ncbi:MAG: DUF2804 domain-containing protein [Desulfobacteraceae bacterium]|nr:DUF2804 domain-containing protein [Desulfobacteraceae bacterium]
MNRLINDQGNVKFGIFESPIDEINYKDFRMSSPMGFTTPQLFKKLLFNQFVFFGLTGPDVIIGMAVVDLKYLSSGFLYIYDRKSGTVSEANKTIVPFSSKIFISPSPTEISCGFKFGNLFLSMENNKITAKTKDIEINLEFDRSQTSPLRICTKAGYKGWVYTEKTSPIKVTGTVVNKDRQINISSPTHMGLMDWTAGYMRRETFWNWAATASTLADGRSLGLNLSCGVNETSFTENAFWIDGKMTKVDMNHFEFNPDNFYDQWKIKSMDGKVNLVFDGEKHREENINAGLVATKFTQLMGTFNGTLKTDEGEVIKIKDCPGWAEDHYAKW